MPMKWPFSKVVETYPGEDSLIRVATVKTTTGSFNRPVTRLALLLPWDEQ